MKNFFLKICWAATLTLAMVTPAWANGTPAPQVLVMEVVILPVMIFFSYLGGYYKVQKKKNAGFSLAFYSFLGLAILISPAHTSFGFFVGLLLALVALVRAGKMWKEYLKIRKRDKPPVSPRRLGLASSILLIATLVLGSFPIVYTSSYFESKVFEDNLAGLLGRYGAYQEAHYRWEKEKTGQGRYSQVDFETFFSLPDYWNYRMLYWEAEKKDRHQDSHPDLDFEEFRKMNWRGDMDKFKIYLRSVQVKTKVASDFQSYQVYLIPRLNPFPYCLIDPMASIYFDERGKAYRRYVRWPGEKASSKDTLIWPKTQTEKRDFPYYKKEYYQSLKKLHKLKETYGQEKKKPENQRGQILQKTK